MNITQYIERARRAQQEHEQRHAVQLEIPDVVEDVMAKKKVHEHLVEVFAIMEYRDGAVYKTRYESDKWVTMDAVAPKGFTYVALSTERCKQRMELGLPLMRTRMVEEDA